MKNQAPSIQKQIDGHEYILGVPIFSGPYNEALKIGRGKLGGLGGEGVMLIATPTTEQLVLAQRNGHFCTILMQSTLNVPDTVGVAWAGRVLGRKSKGRQNFSERIPGVNLAEALVWEALKMGHRVFFLGGREGVAEKAAAKYKQLISFDSGAKDITRETEAERDRVITKIKNFQPDLLLVAYGAPWQEQWLNDNVPALKEARVKIAMVVGGALDIWAKIVPRAPLKWRNLGLEWLWRLIHEPWRFKRQLSLVKFVGLVGREWLVRKLGKV